MEAAQDGIVVLVVFMKILQQFLAHILNRKLLNDLIPTKIHVVINGFDKGILQRNHLQMSVICQQIVLFLFLLLIQKPEISKHGAVN